MEMKVTTALSLNPLPPGRAIRSAVEAYLDAAPQPWDVLRELADAMESGAIPARPIDPPREADVMLNDWRERVHRRSFRLPEPSWVRLRQHAAAAGVGTTTVIRLALRRAGY